MERKILKLEQMADPELLKMLKDIQGPMDDWQKMCEKAIQQANDEFNNGRPFFIYNNKMVTIKDFGEYVFAHINYGNPVNYYEFTDDVFKLKITVEQVHPYRLVREPND